jgi:nucleoside-diphosphate-sugar epimerase
VRVLVTGAGGYIGGAVVRALDARGHVPVALVHRDRGVLAPTVEVRAGDLTRPETLTAALDAVDAVCHLAALTRVRESWNEPMRHFAVNAGGTIALLSAMEEAGVGRLVYASSNTVYGTPRTQPITEDCPDDPPHPYAASKAAAEAAIRWQARSGKLSAVVLRLFNAAGGRDPDSSRIIPRVLAVAAGQEDRLNVNGDGSAQRDFVQVDDAADAFVAAVELDQAAGAVAKINIGSGRGRSVMDVVAAVEKATGRPVPVVHGPPAVEAPKLVADTGLAYEILGWKPVRSDLAAIVEAEWRQLSTG